MPLAGEASDPTPLPNAEALANPPSRRSTLPSARVSRLLPSANLSTRSDLLAFFLFTRSPSLSQYPQFASSLRLGYQTPLDKRQPTPPAPH